MTDAERLLLLAIAAGVRDLLRATKSKSISKRRVKEGAEAIEDLMAKIVEDSDMCSLPFGELLSAAMGRADHKE